MAQRQLLRGASRALTECQASLRSAVSTKHGSIGSISQSVLGRMQSSSAPLSALSSCTLLRSLRQGGVQVSALPATMSMGFAASAPSLSSPISLVASEAQNLGASSTDTSEDGDGEDADPTYSRLVAGPQNSLTHTSNDDEPPDLRERASWELGGPEASGRPPPPRGRFPQSPQFRHDDSAEVVELVAAAREVFTRQPDSSRGPLPPLPREVREAMYGNRWDRVLVDVRRSVERRPRAKEEVYTAMVASGNMAGVLGLGLGTAATAQLAVARAHLQSLTHLAAVPLYRRHTLYHQVDHSYHHMKMLLMPRYEGWGLQCNNLLYELCNVVGIRNVSIRLRGRTVNKFYVAQCFQEALLKQTTPHDGVEATGMYVREVYRNKELPAGLRRGVDVM